MASFGAALTAARTKAGISLREVARRSGFSAPYLSDIEHDRRHPPRRTAEKLAAAVSDPGLVELAVAVCPRCKRPFEAATGGGRCLNTESCAT